MTSQGAPSVIVTCANRTAIDDDIPTLIFMDILCSFLSSEESADTSNHDTDLVRPSS